ncbi:MAG: PKD domain-containing protein [Bacteroidota bacterium]
MKKLILSIVLSLFSLMIYSQTYNVNISGFVIDELTLEPISNKTMLITADSLTGGFMYFNTVITDSSGYYNDVMEVPTNLSGIVEVSTLSCDLTVFQLTFFSPDTPQVVFDFDICTNPAGNDCEAYFSYYDDELPLSIQFIDISTGWPTNWLWDFGDGTTSSEQNPLHFYSEAGDYYTNLMIWGDSCNSEFGILVRVEYDTITDCDSYFIYEYGSEPFSVEFYDESIGDINTWVWDFGDGNTSFEQDPIYNYETAGTYLVSLYIETSDFCISYYEELIYVYGDTTDCNSDFNIALDTLNNIPNTYLFSDLSEGDITSWYWDFGDGNFSIQQNPIHVYTDGSTYFPCLTITTLVGDVICSSTECKDLTTLEYFNFGGQAFIGNYPINIEQVDDANIAIAYLFRKVNHAWHYMDQREFWEYGYYWFVEKPIGEYLIVAELKEASVDYNLYAPSYYPNSISWKNASPFILSNNEQFAVNISLQKLTESISGIGSISGLIIGGPSCDTNYNIDTYHVLVQLFNSSREMISYTYSDLDGNYEFTGLGMGNYFIVPEYTGKYTEEINFTLNDLEPSLNDINLVVNCSHILGVDEIISEYLGTVDKIYPNPVIENADININIKDNSNIKVEIFNQIGQILYSKNLYLTSGKHTINLPVSSFKPGMYYVKLTADDNISSVRKLIKSR